MGDDIQMSEGYFYNVCEDSDAVFFMVQNNWWNLTCEKCVIEMSNVDAGKKC